MFPYVVCSGEIRFPLWLFQGLCIWIWNPSSFFPPDIFSGTTLHTILMILRSNLEKNPVYWPHLHCWGPLSKFLNVCTLTIDIWYQRATNQEIFIFNVDYLWGKTNLTDLCWPPFSNRVKSKMFIEVFIKRLLNLSSITMGPWALFHCFKYPFPHLWYKRYQSENKCIRIA